MSDVERDEAVERLLGGLRREPPVFAVDRQAVVWDAIEARLDRTQSGAWVWALAALTLGVGGAAVWGLIGAEAPSPTQPALTEAPPPERVVDRSLTLATGAVITVAGEARIASATASLTRVALTRGSVASAVPPLGAGRFVVSTPTAEVEVRGTRFEVALLDTAATRIAVTEGHVMVRIPDDRAPLDLEAGAVAVVEPTSAAGAERAAARGDHAQAIEIESVIAESAGDDLARRNALLQVGHAADERAPELAPRLWARIAARHPTGMHADEFAFRHAAALRASGRIDAARAAAATFRAAFPTSPRAAETLAW